MTEKTSYAPGTPNWVDIGVPDTAAAATFYGGLFGWTFDLAPQPEAGGYGMFSLDGKYAAGLGPQQNFEMPPFWTVYVSVVDATATAARAQAHGGTIVVDAMDVVDAGRMAVVQDPNGAFISIWQPKNHIGCQVVNEPNSFVWNELATTELIRATDFYTAVFDWGTMDSSEGSALYTVDGEMVCGAHAAGPDEPQGWSVWFAVHDCDASAAKVTELGGSIITPPSDMDFGRGAMVADPAGAVFGIGAMATPA